MAEYAIYLRYRDITALISTDWDVYHDFVNRYLKNFVCSPVEKPDLDIVSTFPGSSRLRDPQWQDATSGLNKIGESLFVGDRRVYRHDPVRDLTLQVCGEATVEIRCEDRVRLPAGTGARATLRRLRRKLTPRAEANLFHSFQQHLRLTFHHPLFWLLEERHGVHLLHSAAIRISDGAIVFGGLAGVGKSTIATYLHFNVPGVDILSDNFMPCDEERIYGFPEPSRLTRQSLKIAGAPVTLPDSFELRDRQYWVPPPSSDLGVKPTRAFLVSLGSDFGVESISSELFVDTSLRLNDLVKEFHSYDYVGLIPMATRRPGVSQAARTRALESCFRDTPCFLLTIPIVDSLEPHRDEILKVLDLDHS